jgi:hypothetical protein
LLSALDEVKKPLRRNNSVLTFAGEGFEYRARWVSHVAPETTKSDRGESMKRLGYFAMTALLTAGLTIPALAQGKASTKAPAKSDPCATEKAAVKTAGKTTAATKAKADLKACTDKVKASKAGPKKSK